MERMNSNDLFPVVENKMDLAAVPDGEDEADGAHVYEEDEWDVYSSEEEEDVYADGGGGDDSEEEAGLL